MSIKTEEIEELFKNFAGSPRTSVHSQAQSILTDNSGDTINSQISSRHPKLNVDPIKPIVLDLPDTTDFDAAAYIAEIERMKQKAAEKDDKKALEEMHRLCLENQPLFQTVVTDETTPQKTEVTDTSFLITGFGLRNLKSLEEALKKEQREKLQDLYYKMKYIQCHKGDSFQEAEEYSGLTESTSQTDGSLTGTLPLVDSRRRLEYLMGIAEEDLEEGGKVDLEKIVEEVDLEPSLTGETATMRQAQKYLRCHKIFEFFQFLIAHMLSDLPDNPIQYLMDLLDKCLMYRSGYGEPPVLYNKMHIEQLFNLMDPMKTNFIEVDQYVTGMKTLGYCSYNKDPPLSPEGMVSKDFFIDEAYDCGTNLLNDMIRRRWMGKPPPVTPPPPPTPQVAFSSTSFGESHSTLKNH